MRDETTKHQHYVDFFVDYKLSLMEAYLFVD